MNARWFKFSFPAYLAIVVSCTSPKNENAANYKVKIDSIFMDWNGKRPGGAFAVVHKGKVIYESYFGLADIHKNEAFGATTISDIGSVSKQFTAMGIALLEESGKLSIQDDIRKYIPEMEMYSDTIRITHLIHHTSGIKDYEALVNLQNRHYFDDFMTNQYVIDLASKQKSLNFQPGCSYEYSNTNYILMAEIIERLSGQSLNEFASENIFEPLGMKETFFNENQGADFDRKAIGYVPKEAGFESPVYRSKLLGDGGVYTTLKDMIKWDQNFFDNKLGLRKSSLLERMKFIEPFCDGNMGHYAFAQVYTQLPYGTSWSHGGGGGGYRTFYERFEEDQYSFIAMSNTDNSNAFGKVIQTAKLFLEKEKNFEESPNSEKTITDEINATNDLIKKFESYYYDSTNVHVLKVEFDDSNEKFKVITIDEWKDVFLTSLIDSLTLKQEDGENEFILTEMDVLHHKAYDRIVGKYKKLDLIQSDLNTFSGIYYSDEVSHQVELSAENDRLFADNKYFKSLTQISQNMFVDQESGAIIRFNQKGRNQGHAFAIDIRNGDRLARNIMFYEMND